MSMHPNRLGQWHAHLPAERLGVVTSPSPTSRLTGVVVRSTTQRSRPSLLLDSTPRRALRTLMRGKSRRADDRHIFVWQLDDGWHAVVFDGWGRTVEVLADGVPFDDARWEANIAWTALRKLPDDEPWRWTRPPGTMAGCRPSGLSGTVSP
jgi:hypothetical protein